MVVVLVVKLCLWLKFKVVVALIAEGAQTKEVDAIAEFTVKSLPYHCCSCDCGSGCKYNCTRNCSILDRNDSRLWNMDTTYGAQRKLLIAILSLTATTFFVDSKPGCCL